jgi:hypothetical protein
MPKAKDRNINVAVSMDLMTSLGALTDRQLSTSDWSATTGGEFSKMLTTAVIASGAKQSRVNAVCRAVDCFVASLPAMTERSQVQDTVPRC